MDGMPLAFAQETKLPFFYGEIFNPASAL